VHRRAEGYHGSVPGHRRQRFDAFAWRGALVGAAAAVVSLVPRGSGADPGKAPKTPPVWCAPELEALASDVCWFEGPAPGGDRTVVLFLHGLIKPDSTWQWSQQRALVRQAKRYGFSVLAPRGRRGVGPGGMGSVAWPSAASQASVEPELLEEWKVARKAIEARRGKPFQETFMLGYSNGAYYASSLALRERLDVDGYALIAGGSSTPELRKAAKTAKVRVPIWVGIAMGDKTSATDSRTFGALLQGGGWPHKIHASSAGHEVGDRQVERALEYLRGAVKRPAKPAP
jgi:predicted esterase